jgi:hypothetical protein
MIVGGLVREGPRLSTDNLAFPGCSGDDFECFGEVCPI